jgi:hypothetical protein
MKIRHYFPTFGVLIILILTLAIAEAKQYNALVSMKEGNDIRGELISLTPEGVQLDPEGSVKYLFIKADRIISVYVKELDRKFDYPLSEGDVPEDLFQERKTLHSRGSGFPKFLGAFSYGIMTAGNKDYYEGFGSGSTLHINLRYFFHEDDPTSGRFFIGFSYYHSSPKGEDLYLYDPTNPINNANLKLKLSIDHYSLDIGRTTGAFGNGSYLYFMFSGVLLHNKISIPLDSKTEFTYNDSIAGIRGGVGMVIGVASGFGILLSGEIEIVYAGTYRDEFGQQTPLAAGLLPNFTFGIVYGI